MRKILMFILLAHQSVSASLALWPNEETLFCLPEDQDSSFATPFLLMATATLGTYAIKRFLWNHEQSSKCKMLLQGKWIDLPYAFDLAKIPEVKELLDKAHNKKQAEKIFILMSILALIYQTDVSAFYEKQIYLYGSSNRKKRLCYSPSYLEEEEVKLFLRPTYGKFKQKVGLSEEEKLNFENLNRLLEEQLFYDCCESQ